MPCQRGWNYGCHPHKTLLVITKHYNILGLQSFLKENDYVGKLTKKKTQMIIIYIVININKSNNKQGNIKVLMITLF